MGRRQLTVLGAAAKEVEDVDVSTHYLHHLHLLDEVGHLAVCGVVYTWTRSIPTFHRYRSTRNR